MEMRWAMARSAYSSSSYMVSVGDMMQSISTGPSDGFTLRNDGGFGMPGGSNGIASAMAVWTSTAAPSMLRLRSNWRVMLVLPSELFDVIESTPAMVVNWRSRGVS